MVSIITGGVEINGQPRRVIIFKDFEFGYSSDSHT